MCQPTGMLSFGNRHSNCIWQISYIFFQMYSMHFIIRLNWSYHIRLPKNKTSSYYYYYNCLSYQTPTRTENRLLFSAFIDVPKSIVGFAKPIL